MKIDSHHHLWVYRPGDHPWIGRTQAALKRDYLAEEFETELRSAGYSGSVVVQARQSLEETRWLFRQARDRPFLRGVVGWIDLRSPRLEEQLQEFLTEPKLVGFRHVIHDEGDEFLARKDVRRGLGILQHHGLAFDLLIFPRHLPLVVPLPETFPDLTLVIDHLAKPMTEGVDLAAWKRDLRRLAPYPRVSVKLSGLASETVPPRWDPASTEFLLDTSWEAFGPRRLMAASNWPVCTLAGSYAWTMGLVEHHIRRHGIQTANLVLGGNATRIYRLRQPHEEPLSGDGC